MAKKNQIIITVQEREITVLQVKDEDYISLTDMARKFHEKTSVPIENWLKNRSTLDFIDIWEKFYNPDFNSQQMVGIKYRISENSYYLSVKKLIDETNAIGITSRAGRYGGTYAHRDIAFEFASWLSAEFKFYLIKEFQRLKEDENNRQWDYQRFLTKVNYRLHTDTIRDHILPALQAPKNREWVIYADEADLLNMAVFGQTARQWREANPELAKNGNMRDYADIIQLNVLANLESLNSVLIERKVDKEKRFQLLAETALSQYKRLSEQENLKRLE
ncbi:MAG: KilA-N domain-containing protein [Bacteroidetes bacterium]|nr:KilA-N domain-containing protein [Bacteroidota bacterium]